MRVCPARPFPELLDTRVSPSGGDARLPHSSPLVSPARLSLVFPARLPACLPACLPRSSPTLVSNAPLPLVSACLCLSPLVSHARLPFRLPLSSPPLVSPIKARSAMRVAKRRNRARVALCKDSTTRPPFRHLGPRSGCVQYDSHSMFEDLGCREWFGVQIVIWGSDLGCKE